MSRLDELQKIEARFAGHLLHPSSELGAAMHYLIDRCRKLEKVAEAASREPNPDIKLARALKDLGDE